MSKQSSRGGSGGNTVSVQRAKSGNAWVLSHPRAVRDMSEDLQEVRTMIAEGETDVAIDELRWLLGTCSEAIEAHFLLGKLSVETDGDVNLARGHFGFGYQLGIKAWRRAQKPKPMSPLHPANRYFFDCGRGLAWCLRELDKSSMALEIVRQLIELDPNDPLELTAWIDELKTGDKQIVQLDQLWNK